MAESVERVDVRVAEPYPVLVGSGLTETPSELLTPGEAVIITDSDVGPLHADGVRRVLEGAGWRVLDVISVPAGEASKSLAVYEDVVRRLARSGLGRDDALFALGGGVVGDLGGFVAGTYMRGVAFVALPTSLLAMVDSSVGGKVGLDLPEGKNLVGAFVRPRLVLADLDRLATLPPPEISNGLAEIVKMGLLAGGPFFEGLDKLGQAAAGDQEALETLVLHSIRFKAEVVSGDEREAGRRAILNYGHTVGHGLEAAAGYELPHGRAIAAGMFAEAALSQERFGLDLTVLHTGLLRAAGLPLKVDGVNPEKVLAAMRRDKKRRSGGHRFVLLRDVGQPEWDVPVSDDEARQAVEAVVG